VSPAQNFEATSPPVADELTSMCACVRVQAITWCTTCRAKKVTATLAVVALIAEASISLCWYLADVQFVYVIFVFALRVIVPLVVLVINVVVAVQVRRAASNAAANLGVQPDHQSTSGSNSAVPTVMLIATSIIYVLLYSPSSILFVLCARTNLSIETEYFLYKVFRVALAPVKLVFAYNFYVYLITGRLFRSELRKLFCRCASSVAGVEQSRQYADACDSAL